MRWWPSAVLALSIVTPIQPLGAQEVVGKRVFSDQLVISEPFVEDELSLPSILFLNRGGADGGRLGRLTKIGGELKKRILADLELSLGGNLTHLAPDHAPSVTGFDNLEVGLKYQFLRSASDEAVASVAVRWEVGGTGRAATGADTSDTVSPAVLIGKGLGDLPERFALLRPFAFSSVLGLEIPIRRRPLALAWGGVLEYSLPYLESFVRRIGLPPPLSGFVPITEIDLRMDLEDRRAGELTGTVNPGIVWLGPVLQIGVEAVVPVKDRHDQGVGIRAFVRIPLEVIFGQRAGQPMFGAR
ncbi:MAG: hypothetical protein C5B48_12440 [Candidatus Rokuibacteriota bacterium]|nr:MAG: hypothetical protein C5B48_12440 [Candidatus Rokubacteria bacterium]